jgi:hypothetical protein
LGDALGNWSERTLDRTRMPHPILGRITAREMVFFMIYHGSSGGDGEAQTRCWIEGWFCPT